ncbi:hypothetical protein IE53DRAFT_223369 [Violaceomyces palustris]|uniref:Uncharacterized protein n=1 Tax=Violaceomyces palustris TaxID=1673888 RepID=A0ACD0NQ17_9BASI|nr:hypothetical protein IE53DRAFT_223369 [Violaceomyces palustris]
MENQAPSASRGTSHPDLTSGREQGTRSPQGSIREPGPRMESERGADSEKGKSKSKPAGTELAAEVASGAKAKEVDPTKKKPTKKAVSCESCRRRKLKCDRGWPCGACRDRGESNLCMWAEGVRPQALGRDATDSRPVLERLDRLEKTMEAIARRLGVDSDPAQDESEALPLNKQREASAASQVPSDKAFDPSIPDLRRDMSVWRRQLGIGIGTTWKATDEKTSCEVLYNLLRLLPPARVVRELCEFYFIEIAWLNHIIGKAQFDERLSQNEEWRASWTGGAIPNLAEMRDHLRFTSLLCAICGVTLLLGDHDSAAEIDGLYGDEPAYGVLLDAAQQGLAAANPHEDPSIDCIRVLLIIAYAMSAIRSPAAGMATLQVAINIAFTLDLDSEPPSDMPRMMAEDRLRLFSGLCVMDWFSAGTIKRHYSIRPEGMDFPSLFGPTSEKEDFLTKDLRAKLKIANIGRRAADRTSMPEPKAYDLTIQLHSELMGLKASLQPDLVLSDISSDFSLLGVQDVWRRIATTLAIETQCLTLHKRYYIQSWTNPAHKISRDICFSSALNALRLFRNVFQWWLPVSNNGTPSSSADLVDAALHPKQNSIARLWFFAHTGVTSALLLVHYIGMLDSRPEEAKWESQDLRARIVDDLRITKRLLQLLSSRSKVARDGVKALQPPEYAPMAGRSKNMDRRSGVPDVVERMSRSELMSATPRTHLDLAFPPFATQQCSAPTDQTLSRNRPTPTASTPMSLPSYTKRRRVEEDSPSLSSNGNGFSPRLRSGSTRRNSIHAEPATLMRASPSTSSAGDLSKMSTVSSFEDIEALWSKQPWEPNMAVRTPVTATAISSANAVQPRPLLTPSEARGESATGPATLGAAVGLGWWSANSGRHEAVRDGLVTTTGDSAGVGLCNLNQTEPSSMADCGSGGGGDDAFRGPMLFDLSSMNAEHAIVRQDNQLFMTPLAPMSPFTQAFIGSLDNYAAVLSNGESAAASTPPCPSSTAAMEAERLEDRKRRTPTMAANVNEAMMSGWRGLDQGSSSVRRNGNGRYPHSASAGPSPGQSPSNSNLMGGPRF